jgi:hypothetical protein
MKLQCFAPSSSLAQTSVDRIYCTKVYLRTGKIVATDKTNKIKNTFQTGLFFNRQFHPLLDPNL